MGKVIPDVADRTDLGQASDVGADLKYQWRFGVASAAVSEVYAGVIRQFLAGSDSIHVSCD
eukprot:scaffold418852_cov13-Prasinocladus_malaysianus.AAC.1